MILVNLICLLVVTIPSAAFLIRHAAEHTILFTIFIFSMATFIIIAIISSMIWKAVSILPNSWVYQCCIHSLLLECSRMMASVILTDIYDKNAKACDMKINYSTTLQQYSLSLAFGFSFARSIMSWGALVFNPNLDYLEICSSIPTVLLVSSNCLYRMVCDISITSWMIERPLTTKPEMLKSLLLATTTSTGISFTMLTGSFSHGCLISLSMVFIEVVLLVFAVEVSSGDYEE
jgi:hypothetical protein